MGTHWRYGALLTHTEERKHLALIRADQASRTVDLTARGPSPHNLFALLRDGLELTVARFPGLRVRRTVPCFGHDGEPCEHRFEYAYLERAIEREPPIETVQCQVTFEQVSTMQLLFGIHPAATQSAILDEIRRLTTIASDTFAFVQREFLNLYTREQRYAETRCPNVFVLLPVASSGWRRRLRGQRVALQLYCQAPGEWHPTVEGNKGRWELADFDGSIAALAPHVRRLAGLVKFASTVAGPWLGGASHIAGEVEKHIQHMEELATIQPTLEDDREMTAAISKHGLAEWPRGVEGAGLRGLRAILDGLDPKHDWGGLEKIVTPEGHRFWLCSYHMKEFA